MICCNCDKSFPGGCTCPDRDARLATIAASPYIALRRCRSCGKHADLCRCGDGPSTVLVSEGKVVGHPKADKWLKCPGCGAEWSPLISRAMVDCACPNTPVEIEAP